MATALIETINHNDTLKSQRAGRAMLGLRKLDIAALQRAFDG